MKTISRAEFCKATPEQLVEWKKTGVVVAKTETEKLRYLAEACRRAAAK